MFPPQLVAQGAIDRGGQNAGVPVVVVGAVIVGEISSLGMTIVVVGTLPLVAPSAYRMRMSVSATSLSLSGSLSNTGTF